MRILAFFIMEEIWKELIGFERYYKISNTGKIFSLRQNRLVKPGKNKKGYRQFILRGENGLNQAIRIHRQVGMHFIPNPDNLPQLNHKDKDKENNNDWNLEWCTNQQNATHSWENGRVSLKADEIYNAKFTNEQVLEIRKLLNTGLFKHLELAQMYKCAKSTITAINTKRSYKFV